MSVTVRVDLHQGAIRDFLYAPHGEVVRGVRVWSERVRDLAVHLAPKDTGALAGSSLVEMNTRPSLVIGVISFRVRHAMWVHEGTGIYGPRRRPIRARRGGRMKFRSGMGHLTVPQQRSGRFSSGYTYARTVRGQRGNPFLVTALTFVMLPKGARIRRFRTR